MLIVAGLQIWKKTFLMMKIMIKLHNVINEWARALQKKAQIRSEKIALEPRSKTFSVNKSLVSCDIYQLPILY